MSLDAIVHDLAKVRHPVASSYTLPPACYHDADWFQREIEALFCQSWIGVGRRDQWRAPGDFQTLDFGNVSVAITMDSGGELHALSNICLHRSSRIASGGGNCRALVCPFHGWGYDLDGKLLSAPRMENAEDFSTEGLALRRFSVAEQGGFVFINLADAPDELEHWLGDFPDLHKPWFLADMVTGRGREFTVECNWKLFIEVFNEYYHLPYVHPDTLDGHYPEPESADDVIGEYTSQFGATSSNPALLSEDQADSFPVIPTLDDRLRNGARYTWVYPNASFALGADCMWMYHVLPVSSTETRVVQSICFPESTTERPDFAEKAETYYRRFDCAMDEDIPALLMQQAGMQSPHAKQGRFSTLEPSVGNFACWYAEAMGSEV